MATPPQFIGTPPQLLNNSRTNQDAIIRSVLRRSWNNKQAQREISYDNETYRRRITPFRAVKSAGDYLLRENAKCGGPTPHVTYAPGRTRLLRNMQDVCDLSMIAVPVSSNNSKHVFDSSEYTRFVREKAFAKTFRDDTRR